MNTTAQLRYALPVGLLLWASAGGPCGSRSAYAAPHKRAVPANLPSIACTRAGCRNPRKLEGAEPASARRYTVQQVIDASVFGESAKYYTPVDVNDQGDVLFGARNGYTRDNTLSPPRPGLIVRADGTVVHLQPLAGDVYVEPLHFLPDGRVFGASFDDHPQPGGTRAAGEHRVVWRGEKPEALGFPLGVGGLSLRLLASGDLMERGVSDARRRYVSPFLPVILHPDGSYHELPLPEGCRNAYSMASSPLGTVVAGVIPSDSTGNSVFGPLSQVPAVWRNGEVHTLSAVPGYKIQGKFSVNDSGQVLAFTNPGPDEDLKDRARHMGTVFWPQPDAPRIVPRLTPTMVTRLLFLNNSGDAVGGAYHGFALTRAVLYSGGKLLDLNTLTVPRKDVELQEALLISNGGTIVADRIKNEKWDVFYVLKPIAPVHPVQ